MERRHRNATEVTSYVDLRMYQWARFARDRFDELGYPAESPSTKLLREFALGIAAGSGRHDSSLDWPPEVAATERCVSRLCRRAHFGDVIDVTYLAFRDDPNEVRARRMKVSPRRYAELLSRFRNAMFGALLMEDSRGP